jgi:hypothetical protein
MKCRQLLRLTVFVGALGMGVPGCFLFGSDNHEGRICASPVEGKTYCVASSSGSSGAWNKAAAAGTEPIQMWAVWPDNVELNDVVTSPNLLNAWLDDVRTVMDYLRVTQGNAESYHASLSGNLGDRLRQARRVQNEIIHDKSVDSTTGGNAMTPSGVPENGQHLWTLLDTAESATRALGNA